MNPQAPHEKKSFIALSALAWGIQSARGLRHVGQVAVGGFSGW